ncbi:MAG: bifunctional phosphopantothenoylcysteine decarboxylase/phosphopantothenate synthase, partial [Phycisphaerae bacterium]
NRMWENPAVQRNLKKLQDIGFVTVGPVEGRLACGTEAIGRMAEPVDIIAVIEKTASKIKK